MHHAERTTGKSADIQASAPGTFFQKLKSHLNHLFERRTASLFFISFHQQKFDDKFDY